ncbi:MAG: PAS domain-containing protein [Deferrisomatales bacterium]|nr:PAS domain-containing protein [Deferrisomatales bacterium]
MRGRGELLEAVGAARALFDALPLGAFLVDRDRVVQAVNARGRQFLGSEVEDAMGLRPGEALRCVNSLHCPEGCGHAPACQGCVLRECAEQALAGATAEQREVRLVTRGTNPADRALLVSAAPISWGGRSFALLLLQDVSALHRLRGLLPICAGCKKIRREDQAWEAVEAFVERHSLAEFTHGLCPECLERLYPECGEENPTPEGRHGSGGSSRTPD